MILSCTATVSTRPIVRCKQPMTSGKSPTKMTPRESTLDPVIAQVHGPVVLTPTGEVRWTPRKNQSFTASKLRGIAIQLDTLEWRQGRKL